MAILEIKDIRKSYKNKEVLTGVSLEAEKGVCVGILGKNGCGKSTLLEVLAGILRADGGSFVFEGRDLFTKGRALSESVGYVPQGEPFFEELTAKDNLRIFYDKKELEKELSGGLLETLGINEFLNKRVSKLSGGMKKRLSIGCAMARNPGLLLLDEPTGALDLPGKLDLYGYFSEYKKRGGIILLVTHDLKESELCDCLYHLKDGKLLPLEKGQDLTAIAGILK